MEQNELKELREKLEELVRRVEKLEKHYDKAQDQVVEVKASWKQ